MTTISKNAPVLVTGATGYVAGWLVSKLLDEGITVHAAVRNPDNTSKIEHLNKLAANAPGIIKYFKSDLLQPGSYKEAMEGCELVYHTASPFTSKITDPQKDLIDPAVKGTENVLQTASEVDSVKRVVVTSSCVAIYNDAIDSELSPSGMLTEAMWNESASIDNQPYSYSKTLAEKKAWDLAKNQKQWDLVTVNPSFVMGPVLNPKNTTSESFNVLKQFGDGTLKMGAPKLGVGVVDVRDLAEAHYLAGHSPHAKGRYIASGHNTDFLSMGKQLEQKFGDRFPIPTKAIPKWLLMLVGPMMDKSLTRRFIKNNVNIEWLADNSKIRNDLGVSFRPLQETMEDGFGVLVDSGVFSKN